MRTRENSSWRVSCMRGRRFVHWRWMAVPVLILLAVTLPHLGQGDWRGDAGWYSAIALDAWRTGKLWTLHAGPGDFYFNKPPLAFWIHGLFLHALGPSIWAARLPSVLAACGCAAITAGIARNFANRWPALLAGGVLALTYEFFRRNREISLDLWQLLFMLGAVWALAVALRRDRLALAALGGVCLGLALLVKPLMALAAIPVLAAWMLWAGQARRLWWLVVMAVAAVAVASPWHLSMALQHGEAFTAQYFGAEVAARAAGEAVGGQLERKPVWFYLQLLASTYWPWMVFVVVGMWGWRRSRKMPEQPAMSPSSEEREEPRAGGPLAATEKRAAASGRNVMVLLKLAAVWTLAWLVILTVFPDRRPRYALPLYPGLAWLAAAGLVAPAMMKLRPVVRGLANWAVPLAVLGGVLFAVLPVKVQSGPSRQWVEFFDWMAREAPGGVHDGSFGGAPGARVYLQTGRWPVPTRDQRERIIAEPAEGDLLAYHRRGGRAPGANEAVVFESGDLKVTRLGPGGWNPVLVDDPGE